MGAREDLGILLAHAGQFADVEEATVTTGDGIDVEVLAPEGGIGPIVVGIVGGHVVGNDIEGDPKARLVGGARQSAKAGLPAERVRQAPRVNHVVTMHRAGPGLERGREVQMRNAQVAQIRDQRPSFTEAEVGAELEAVGGAGGGRHWTRLRITVVCAWSLSSVR